MRYSAHDWHPMKAGDSDELNHLIQLVDGEIDLVHFRCELGRYSLRDDRGAYMAIGEIRGDMSPETLVHTLRLQHSLIVLEPPAPVEG